MKKKVRNWKVVWDSYGLKSAIEILESQKSVKYDGPFAIRHGRRFITPEDYRSDITFNLDEINGLWEILIPDNDQEEKNEKIRNLVKNSNCSGLTHAKIDNMTIDEIWKTISDSLTTDKKYRMLLLYYNNKIYKDN